MITWIASFPRSGNTLLRLILNRVFDVGTSTIYSDDIQVAELGNAVEIVGHTRRTTDADTFVNEMRNSRQMCFIKTHAPPSDDAPAIYVVRDGRSAVVSYAHYTRALGWAAADIENILTGTAFGGMWSTHVYSWKPLTRPNTLVVRYEKLAAADPETIAAIGAFIEREPVAAFDVSFDALQRVAPKFFRRGSDEANIAELEANFPALFRLYNAPFMTMMGYAMPPLPDFEFALREEVRKIVQKKAALETKATSNALTAVQNFRVHGALVAALAQDASKLVGRANPALREFGPFLPASATEADTA